MTQKYKKKNMPTIKNTMKLKSLNLNFIDNN